MVKATDADGVVNARKRVVFGRAMSPLEIELSRRLTLSHAWVVRGVIPAHVLDVVREISGGNPRLIEPLGSVPIRACDARMVSLGMQASQGSFLVADNTLATLAHSSPCTRGANIHLEQLDALPSGEGLLLVGVARKQPMPERLALYMESCDPPSDAHAQRVLEELDDFVDVTRRSSAVAKALGAYLRCHYRVSTLFYPGLPQDTTYLEARTALHHGFGPYIDLRCCDEAYERRIVEALQATAIHASRPTVSWSYESGSAAIRSTASEPAASPWLRLTCKPVDVREIVSHLEVALA